MKRLRPDAEGLAKAASALRGGALVAFPTETVYGLGADATNGEAVALIFKVKGRPRFNPLIVHVPDLAAAEGLVELASEGRRLARAFWPGGLTLVAKRSEDCPVSRLASAGLDTLAVRVPAHPVARALLEAAALPLAAPSANTSGRISPTTAEHVLESLGGTAEGLLPFVLDGGPSALGLESTVVGVVEGNRPVLLRPGAVARDEIERVLGAPLAEPAAEGAEEGRASPGRLESHYAPNAPLRLGATEVRKDELLLAFGPKPPEGAAKTINLSERGDLVEAAARLFAALHELDAVAAGRTIAVMPIPEEGLGEAINDRLKRAAQR